MTALLRLLELVRRDLGAEDARAEIGGAEPADPRLVFAPHPGGFRVVAVFAQVPAEPERVRARLGELLDSFAGVTADVELGEVRVEVSIARRLDSELELLAERVAAARAFVVDRDSPVIWGSSGKRFMDDGVDVIVRLMDVLSRARQAGIDAEALSALDAEAAERSLVARGLDLWSARFLAKELARCRDTGEVRRELAASMALARLREEWPSRAVFREGGFGALTRGFAGIYALVLAFDGTFSELHAEGLMLRALPLIERLVLSLPPVEPPDKPGKVVRLRAPR